MKGRLVSMLLFASLLGGNILSTYSVFAEGNSVDISKEVKTFEFSNQILNKLNEIEQLTRKAENSKRVEDLDSAISAFMDIHKLIKDNDVNAHKNGDKFDDLYLKIREMLYNLPTNIRNKKIVDFQQKLCNCLKTKIWTFYNEYLYYTESTNTIPEIQNQLIKAISDYNQAKMPEKGKENSISKEANKDNGLLPNAPNMKDINKPKPIKSYYPVKDQNVVYKAEGKDCYKVITYYIDGKASSVKKEKAIKSEYVFCNIFDYVDFGGGNYSSNNLNGGLYGNWDYLNQTQNPESNMTLQYTVEKDSEKPYYFDTGIRTALDGTVSYDQLKDTIYQVAVKSKGYVVEDKNKILAIMEGKPIVFLNTKAKYTKTDIDKIFNGFKKIDVRIMETRIGKSESLEGSIMSKQAKKVKIEDKDIELTANPIVKNDRALLPVEQIASELGATIKKNENTFVINKDKAIIKYQEKKNILIVNGKEKNMDTSPEYKDGYFMAEVQQMAEALEYIMTWNGESSTIIFNKK